MGRAKATPLHFGRKLRTRGPLNSALQRARGWGAYALQLLHGWAEAQPLDAYGKRGATAVQQVLEKGFELAGAVDAGVNLLDFAMG